MKSMLIDVWINIFSGKCMLIDVWINIFFWQMLPYIGIYSACMLYIVCMIEFDTGNAILKVCINDIM